MGGDLADPEAIESPEFAMRNDALACEVFE
jgi:hypothetical protein